MRRVYIYASWHVSGHIHSLTPIVAVCIRYAGIISLSIGAVSTFLFMTNFRRKALQLRELVEEHFDPIHGWPKDPTVLTEDEVSLLTGGARSWTLDYAFLNSVPVSLQNWQVPDLCA